MVDDSDSVGLGVGWDVGFVEFHRCGSLYLHAVLTTLYRSGTPEGASPGHDEPRDLWACLQGHVVADANEVIDGMLAQSADPCGLPNSLLDKAARMGRAVGVSCQWCDSDRQQRAGGRVSTADDWAKERAACWPEQEGPEGRDAQQLGLFGGTSLLGRLAR